MKVQFPRRVGIALVLVAVLSTSACFPTTTEAPPPTEPTPTESKAPDSAAAEDAAEAESPDPVPIVESPPMPPVFWQPSPQRTTPATPVLTLRSDTGASASDGITKVPTVDVRGLNPSGSWEHWSGTAWVAGSGSSFNLAEGTFAAGAVMARQTVGGVRSAAGVLPGTVTVDLTPPAAATFAFLNDTGTAGDWTSADGTVTIGVTDPGAWQVRTSPTDPWGVSAASVLLPVGTTLGLSVRQTDAAGNERITDAPSVTVVTSVAGDDPVITPALMTTLLQRNTGFTISGTVPTAIGDVLLDNLGSVAAGGIPGTLEVTGVGIAGASLTQLADAVSGLLVVRVLTAGLTTVDLSGWTGASEVRGGASDNTLIGGSGDDRLIGGNGNDTLIGGAGNDELYGSNGINRLHGGPGEDFLSLGGTSNTVVITVADAVGQPIDRITGFISGLDYFELEHPDLAPGPLDSAELYIDPGMMFTGMPVGNESFVLSGWNGTTFDSNRRLWACYQTGAACTALVNLGTASFVVASDIVVT